jgi:hypothetical protein
MSSIMKAMGIFKEVSYWHTRDIHHFVVQWQSVYLAFKESLILVPIQREIARRRLFLSYHQRSIFHVDLDQFDVETFRYCVQYTLGEAWFLVIWLDVSDLDLHLKISFFASLKTLGIIGHGEVTSGTGMRTNFP